MARLRKDMVEGMQRSVPIFPSPGGLTTLTVNVKPVSSQSSGARKADVRKAIRAITSQIDTILTSDVQVEIAWYINEVERYETDRPADADNIIKPIIDALTGREGIIVNDCQVQSVTCYWLDRFRIPEHIEIQIKYQPDAFFFRKNAILFVKIKHGLCLPINNGLTPKQLTLILDDLENRFKYRDNVLKAGRNPDLAYWVMPIQRIFHISRCRDFPVIPIDDLRKRLNQKSLPEHKNNTSRP